MKSPEYRALCSAGDDLLGWQCRDLRPSDPRGLAPNGL